ncbi:SRPBCC domain-containing protein [Ancylomarina salipaludis]|uniref:SRPBCC domain-containing protein n=1 Tax=Ancylomarina salipaludis TaxID=2501299 RepID=A0A4Q1JJK9_9BACT|nr:SRPBCC domain-containing protein [Ancylomarina salipaludis]RXQ91028.1 SRPBCC domain-containing protein [Ancylomarina salipaludis]
MTEKNSRVIVEQNFAVPLSQLWKAISELDQMKQWFFENIEDFRPEVGFETQFSVKSGERNFKHLWRLSEVIHLEKLVYSWKYEGYDGESVVSFETFINEGGSSLRVSHFVTKSFDQSIPEFTRESCQQGWEYFIKDRLKAFLEN